jgi:CubicO group peptidase (beta-lactamase class C family)
VIDWRIGVITLAAYGCAASPSASPAPIPVPRADWHDATAFLDSVVAAGAAPGAVLAISYRGNRFVHPTGQLGADDPGPVQANTVYDLASLTKVIGLTTAVMFAVEEHALDLDAPVQRYVPGFVGPDKERVTLRMLLTHTSGLPAWRPLFREVTSREQAFASVDTTPLEKAPGTAETYSDLGAILLTQIVESVYHERLDSLLQRRLFRPLGMTSTGYLPPSSWQARIAPTELDPWRGRVLRGEVHDENAAIMDGISGHAGLFSTAEDLLVFAEWLLEQAVGRSVGQAVGSRSESSGDAAFTSGPADRPTIRPSVITEFTRRQNLVPGSSRALGWDTPAPGSSAGTRLSSHSIGHTGFTGTSLWIDFDRRIAIVLLSNRVNPTRDNPRWAPVRSRIADLVMTTVLEDIP